MGNWAKRKFVG